MKARLDSGTLIGHFFRSGVWDVRAISSEELKAYSRRPFLPAMIAPLSNWRSEEAVSGRGSSHCEFSVRKYCFLTGIPLFLWPRKKFPSVTRFVAIHNCRYPGGHNILDTKTGRRTAKNRAAGQGMGTELDLFLLARRLRNGIANRTFEKKNKPGRFSAAGACSFSFPAKTVPRPDCQTANNFRFFLQPPSSRVFSRGNFATIAGFQKFLAVQGDTALRHLHVSHKRGLSGVSPDRPATKNNRVNHRVLPDFSPEGGPHRRPEKTTAQLPRLLLGRGQILMVNKAGVWSLFAGNIQI